MFAGAMWMSGLILRMWALAVFLACKNESPGDGKYLRGSKDKQRTSRI